MPCPSGNPAMSSRRRANGRSRRSAVIRSGGVTGMFERLETVIPGPILALMAAFRADSDPRKVELGVGGDRDGRGATTVLAPQTTKTYVAASGNAAFNEAIEHLVLGDQHEARVTARVRTVQSPGGCGALRLGAELIRAAAPDSVVHVSTPTLANHMPLLAGSGLKLERYPYF